MIEKPPSLGAPAAAAATLGKEGLAGLAPGAARAMLEKAATGFPSSPSAVTTPLPPNPGTLAVQITLSAAAAARLAGKPETVNRTAANLPGIVLDNRQLLDPRASSIPLPVERAKEQLPQGDRPIPQRVRDVPEEAVAHDTTMPARPASASSVAGPAAPPAVTQKERLPQGDRPSRHAATDVAEEAVTRDTGTNSARAATASSVLSSATPPSASQKAEPPAPDIHVAQPAPVPSPKETAVSADAPHVPVPTTPAEPPAQRLTGLVAESALPGRAVVMTTQGPVTLPTTLPVGARVEIALSRAGVTLVSVLAGPTTPAAAGGDDGVLPADHRLGAALLAMGKELMSRAEPETLPAGGEAAATVLWFGTPERPVPLSMETVPLLDEDGGGNGRKRRSTRFRFGLRLDGIGALQLDGMVRRQRFDLRVRTEIVLGAMLRQEIEEIFHEALSLGGIAGSIAFAGTPGTWGQAHVMVSPISA